MNDICIRRVVNMFYLRTDRWKRETPMTRTLDAAVLFTEGEIEYYFEGKTLTAHEGDLLFLPGHLPYSGLKKSHTVAFFVVEFECDTSTSFEEFGAPSVITLPSEGTLPSQFSDTLALWNQQPIDCALRSKAFTYALLCAAFKEEERREHTVASQEILSYIVENLHDSAITVGHLCHRFYISESQLRRNIQKATGHTPNEYILLLRLNRAKNELLRTDKPIHRISAECGFASPYYFSRRFSAQFGCSPVAWRQKHTAT